MADERLALRRSRSICRSRLDTVNCWWPAISRTALQKGSSRLTLVLCPPMTTDRLVMADFMQNPPNVGGNHQGLLPDFSPTPLFQKGSGNLVRSRYKFYTTRKQLILLAFSLRTRPRQ